MPAAVASPNPGSSPVSPPATGPCPTSRVLLIEDSRALRRIIARCLEQKGASVTTCETGEAGVEAALAAATADQPFDVVLMDVVLPGMNGIDATWALREQGYAGRIIVLTAVDAEYDLARAICAGADHWLAKPFDCQQLLKAIADAGDALPA
jgi:DNA-binding response OmpR family regulator